MEALPIVMIKSKTPGTAIQLYIKSKVHDTNKSTGFFASAGGTHKGKTGFNVVYIFPHSSPTYYAVLN